MVERCSVTSSNTPPLLRVGWANTRGFNPYPTGGNFYGQNAIGDDAFSFSYDGISLWNGELRVCDAIKYHNDHHLKIIKDVLCLDPVNLATFDLEK